jgi:hypothetical protein
LTVGSRQPSRRRWSVRSCPCWACRCCWAGSCSNPAGRIEAPAGQAPRLPRAEPPQRCTTARLQRCRGPLKPAVTMRGRPTFFRGGGVSQGSPPGELLRPLGLLPAGAYGTRRSCLVFAPGADRGHGMDGRHPGPSIWAVSTICRPKTTGKPSPAWHSGRVFRNGGSWPSQMPGTARPVSILW